MKGGTGTLEAGQRSLFSSWNAPKRGAKSAPLRARQPIPVPPLEPTVAAAVVAHQEVLEEVVVDVQ
jgi:hypothetical protein